MPYRLERTRSRYHGKLPKALVQFKITVMESFFKLLGYLFHFIEHHLFTPYESISQLPISYRKKQLNNS